MKKEKGITLIALVITIIVLIILALVTINYVFDQNLIQRAVASNETSIIESIREKLELVKGNMYIDNNGKSSIEAYMTSLGEKDLEPYVLTSKSTLSDTLGIVVVDGKYSYLIKFDDNISIEYEGKLGEIDRTEQVIEIVLTAEETQNELPINISAQVTADGENVKSGTWKLAKVNEDVEENVATGTIEGTGNIALEISEVGTYNLHVITTDKYGRESENIKGEISVTANYHTHATSCYKTCGGTYSALEVNGWSYKMTCNKCGAYSWQASDTSWICGLDVVACGNTTSTINAYTVSY